MGSAITPYIAKNAAPLVNPTSITVFPQLVLNQLAAAPTRSAYVKYDVFTNANSTTTQVANTSQAGSHAEPVNTATFLIRAWGRVTGGTTTNFTPTLQFGNSPTAATNTTIGSLTASAFNTASGVFSLKAELIWDITSGQISGNIGGFNGSTAAIVANSLTTPITGQTIAVFPAGGVATSFYFSMAGLFSASNASNLVILDGFQLEDI